MLDSPLSATGYGMGVFFRNSSTVARSSPASTARTTSPCSLKSWYIFSTAGMDFRHGPHQVAQKSSNTGLPLSFDRLYDLPSSALMSKASASLPARSALGSVEPIRFSVSVAPSGGVKANKEHTSEERRVGKECRSRWAPCPQQH